MVHNTHMPDKSNSITIAEALRQAAIQLHPKKITCAADKTLGRLEAEILLAHVLNTERIWLITNQTAPLSSAAYRNLQTLIARRKTHEPIAYILGKKEFYGLSFRVTPDTLIPRPETELLVDLALTATHAPVFWDIGTGSGAIAIALAYKNPLTTILATDISSRALTVARTNAKKLKTTNIIFKRANLADTSIQHALKRLCATRPSSTLIIVANLPYLPTSDKQILERDVVEFEPSNALFVGEDGTELIEKLLHQLAALNIRFDAAFFEFDPPQATKLKRLAHRIFPQAHIVIHKDLAKRNRVLEISQPTRSL